MTTNNNCQEEKVVLVTGASSGIGEATAIEYAKLGYKIAITGRNKERLEKVLNELIRNSPSPSASSASQDYFISLQADFEDPAQVEPIIEQTINKFKRLDILINNAGYLGKKYEIQHPEFYDDFKRILQVNLFASVRLCQLARPFLEQSKGVIVNVSSIADRMAMPAISYSVSKAGLSMLTRALTNALDGTGMRIVTVSPGPVVTNITNPEYLASMGVVSTLNRAGKSQEVADTIVFLTSDKASFITGCAIDVDGGVLVKHGGMFITHKDLIE